MAKTSALFKTLAQGIWNQQSPKDILQAMLVVESLQGKDYSELPSFQKLFREVYGRKLTRSISMLLDMGVVPDDNTLRMLAEGNSDLLRGRQNLIRKLPYSYWKYVGNLRDLLLDVLTETPSLFGWWSFRQQFTIVEDPAFIRDLYRRNPAIFHHAGANTLQQMALMDEFSPESYPELYANLFSRGGNYFGRAMTKWGNARLLKWIPALQSVLQIDQRGDLASVIWCTDRNSPSAGAHMLRLTLPPVFHGFIPKLSDTAFSDAEINALTTSIYTPHNSIMFLGSRLPSLDEFTPVFFAWLETEYDIPYFRLLPSTLSFIVWLTNTPWVRKERRYYSHNSLDDTYNRKFLTQQIGLLWSDAGQDHLALWLELQRLGIDAQFRASLSGRAYLPRHFELLGIEPSANHLGNAIRANNSAAIRWLLPKMPPIVDIGPSLLTCFENRATAAFEALASTVTDVALLPRIAELRGLLVENEDAESEEAKETASQT
jgi:hypothetical protein